MAARTAAITTLERAGVLHELHPFDDVDVTRVFKTLIVSASDGRFVVAIVPLAAKLDMRTVAAVLGVKQVELASARDAERLTGYVLGAISPFGQRRALPTVLDATARDAATIFVSGGRRGLEIEVAPGDLVDLLDARVAQIARF
jgi:Cys-tRNA(Pro)/Cys-tRNA(Cys) deacylase